jgi:hypothetical protein
MKFITINHHLNLLPSLSPLPLVFHPPYTVLLEQFQQVSFLCFHVCTQNISTIFTLICPCPLLTSLQLVPTPGKDLFYPSVLNFFFKCILIVQGGFTLVLQACIYRALVKLTTSLITFSLLPCSRNIQWFMVDYVMLHSCIDDLFQYFSFSNTFFVFLASCCSLRQSH